MLNAHRIHLLACRCLEREKFLEERVQALKLFRAISCFAAEKSHVRYYVAWLPLQLIAMMHSRKRFGKLAGICFDSLLLTILHLLGQHQTRIWLRPSLDLAVLLAPFTSTSESQEDAEVQRQRRKLSQKAIATMMRTWTGLFILA
ncbi:hypothetical protein BASA81_003200 [Batrachochytrium salamandrivorans]|nr:hypothetical protein BASA81_003200 [Batrachochytrium salamandrivorans]